VEEIGEILIGVKLAPGGMLGTAAPPEPLRLKEVARVEDAFIESQRILEVEGEPTIWLIVRKQSGANTVRTCETILGALPQIQRDTGADVEYRILWDQSEIVKLALGNLSSSGLQGIVICFFVLLVFLLNIRASLIVSTAIPLSVIATFLIMDLRGMTLNVLSMAGLSLGIGMLVDNSIVVLENIFRLRQEGQNPWQAAIHGARTVGLAVSASTLTTVAVFVPVLFVPGIAGVLFKDMAITICFSLLVSLVVSLTFIPLAASRLLASPRAERLLQRALERDLLRGIRPGYRRTMEWCLSHRWVVGLGVLGMIGVTVVMYGAMPQEFIAEDDQSMVYISVETAIGNNLQEATKVIKEVRARVLQLIPPEERKLVTLDAGVGKGFVAIFAKGVHAGALRVNLVPVSKRQRSQKQIEEQLREELAKIPGVKATVGAPFNPMGGEGDIEVQLRGHDLEASRAAGLELQEKFRAMPEVSTVTFSLEDQKPEVRVRFDRAKMAQLGISAASVGNTISAAFMGVAAGRYSEGGDEYDIQVRYGKRHRLDVDQIRRLPVATRAGAVLPLQNIAEVREALGPVNITRLNQERVTRLILSLRSEYKDANGDTQLKDLGGSISRAEDVLKKYAWPKDLTWTIGGTAEDFQTSFKYLGIALMVAILIVFMVMAAQFESLRQPFIIMFTMPLAGIGVVILFAVTQTHLDVSSLIGIIMLPGIVVNNGIVMVDAANQFREQGMDRKQAILHASVIRLRPVLMTALTTIFAMLPLALGIGEGAAEWIGMARAVIGGLATATVFTLVVVPVVYTLFAEKQLKQHKYAVTEPTRT
jgi:HAE1 family hydrophobic/amphiphilic exporter-1